MIGEGRGRGKNTGGGREEWDERGGEVGKRRRNDVWWRKIFRKGVCVVKKKKKLVFQICIGVLLEVAFP